MEEVGQTHIIGCGDIGRRVALLCKDNGLKPVAWVRSESSQAAGTAQGICMRNVDLDQHAEQLLQPLNAATPLTVYYFVPPPPSGLVDTRLSAVLANIRADKIVMISTTGVYGNCQGRWINEDAPLNPVAERAVRRVDAEQQLRLWCNRNKRPYVILRVPGIYAQDRLPLKRIQSGAPIVRAEQAPWTNRIHADDLAQACYLAMTTDCENETINVCDDQPSTMTAYFKAVADYHRLPHPPEISLSEALATLSTGMRSYLQESRRIHNTKMKQALGLKLQYPNLAAGLKLIKTG